MGASLYDASPNNRTEALFDWEERWFDRYLPPPEAGEILAGGVGAGREVVALQQRGHAVVAFEPSLEMAAVAKERTNTNITHASYADLVTAHENALTFGGRDLSQVEFSAVLLGWGSLTHVLEEAEAEAILRTLDAMCPQGPLLASFLTTAIRGGSNDRVARYGHAIGARLRLLRGLSPMQASTEVVLDPHVGFLRFWDPNVLAEMLPHRRMEFVPTPYPHAIFFPASAGTRGDL